MDVIRVASDPDCQATERIERASQIVEHAFAMFGQDEWLAVFRAEYQMNDDA